MGTLTGLLMALFFITIVGLWPASSAGLKAGGLALVAGFFIALGQTSGGLCLSVGVLLLLAALLAKQIQPRHGNA